MKKTKPKARKTTRKAAAPQVYRMPPPNDDLFDNGGHLSRVRRSKNGRAAAPFWVFQDLPPVPDHAWVDPRALQEALLDDKELLAAADALARRPSQAGFERLLKQLEEFFDTKYLPRVLQEFDEAVPLLAHWLIARQSHDRAGLLDDPPQEEADEPARKAS